jgi:deoxyadenosine/deoxycytidine kinase
MSTSSPLFISVEGNIGSGKSTLVRVMDRYLKQYTNLRICFLQEPVDIWETIRDKENKTIIELFYSDQKKYSFAFQMMAYISRLSIIKNALKENYDIIISERSLNTDKNVFAKMLYDAGNISEVEYQIYLKWFEEFVKDIPEQHIIFVETLPETAFKRVNKRSRKGETIPLDYLSKCCDYHNEWICPKLGKYKQMIVIDGEQNIDNNPSILFDWLDMIHEWIKNLMA